MFSFPSCERFAASAKTANETCIHQHRQAKGRTPRFRHMSSTAGEHIAPGHTTSASRPGVLITELGLVAMALIWGVNFSVVKFGTRLVDPLAYNGVRISIAAAVLCVVVWLGRTPLPPARTIVALLALGVLGNGIY